MVGMARCAVPVAVSSRQSFMATAEAQRQATERITANGRFLRFAPTAVAGGDDAVRRPRPGQCLDTPGEHIGRMSIALSCGAPLIRRYFQVIGEPGQPATRHTRSIQPKRSVRRMNWAASGTLVAFMAGPSHSNILPVRMETQPNSMISVRRPAISKRE